MSGPADPAVPSAPPNVLAAAPQPAPGPRTHPGTGRVFASPVPAGAGWPGDPATVATVAARDPADVVRLAAASAELAGLDAAVSVCRACPRLVSWREEVAAAPRRSHAGEAYWGRAVTGWGAADAGILLLGLAPAAHGGNRTGRVFTGDRSGDWLFAALHRCGLAEIATSTAAGDGQRLDPPGSPGVRISAAVHCAPPANAPTPAEITACRPWLLRELALMGAAGGGPRVVVALGGLAWATALGALAALGTPIPRPRPRFGHGRELMLPVPDRAAGAAVASTAVTTSTSPAAVLTTPTPPAGPSPHPVRTLLGCYHPSQQNTFTGVLTEEGLDAVLGRARALAVACEAVGPGARRADRLSADLDDGSLRSPEPSGQPGPP